MRAFRKDRGIVPQLQQDYARVCTSYLTKQGLHPEEYEVTISEHIRNRRVYEKFMPPGDEGGVLQIPYIGCDLFP